MFYVGVFFLSFISSNNPTSNVPLNYPQISLLSECWYTDNIWIYIVKTEY